MEGEREQWIKEYEGGDRVSEIARRHQISRKALYKWIERYEEYGVAGLNDLSRAPEQHPQAVSELWRQRIRGARQQQPRWGAPKLAWWLGQRHGGDALPSVSTIGRVLRDSGLSRSRRRVKAHGTGKLEPAERANQVWAIDFKGWCRTGDGARCEPLTISDQATRYLLCCQALSSTRTELVRPVMERVFAEYGLPERIRSDNGAPFAVKGECGLTELAVWWIELGIHNERIDPGHPQQNGRHERMHRTLQEVTMEPPASTARQQQRRLEAFQREYNERRPHQALGQQVPASLFRPSPRIYRESGREPEYGSCWQVRKVDGGRIRWPGGKIFVSHALNGKLVGVEPIEEGLWKLWFHHYWLGMWDAEEGRLWHRREWAAQRARRSAQQGCASGSLRE
jgi:putative transposase